MNVHVSERLKSCFYAKEFSAMSLRGAAMGAVLAIGMSDVALYKQLETSINYGQLPWYITDVLIVTSGSLEALSAPFWSWFGQWRIRTMTFVSLLAAVSTLGLLTLPAVPMGVGSELCTGAQSTAAAYTTMSTAGALRLTVIILIGLVNMVGRAALWNNAIVLMDMTDPADMSLNYGILAAARVLSLIMLPKILNEQMAFWTQVVGAVAPLLIHSLQIYRLPDPSMREENAYSKNTDTRFGASFCRVLTSGQVMGLILAKALLVSSLWGYKWHDSDITKMLYFVAVSKDYVTNQTEFLYYHALILAVVTYGLYYGKSVFDKASAMKLATIAALVITPLYSVQTMVLTCQSGLVGGLEQTFNYTQPLCSNQCRCEVPYSQFAPVCVPDTMTTYLSPCHAGCSTEDLVDGVRSYRSCACAMPGSLQRATVGACNAVQCMPYYILHKVLGALIVILFVLAIQALLVTILRLVDPVDRPITVGLASAVVFLLTFCCTHLAYFGLRASSCAWEEGGRCQFYTPTFLKAVGGISSGLTGLATIICLVIWIVIKRTHVKAAEHIPMDRFDIS